MKQVIIQFKTTDFQDADPLTIRHELEETIDGCLQRNLGGIGYIDGGDIGKEEMNIFAVVKSWSHPIELIQQILKKKKYLEKAVIAKRMKDDTYRVVWPKNYKEKFTIC